MRLSKKLSIVLIITVLTAGVLISIFSLKSTNSYFAQYIFTVKEAQLDQWEEIFSQYYRQQGSWQGVDKLRVMGGRHMMGSHGMGYGSLQGIVLTDNSGKVLNSPASSLKGTEVAKGLLNQGRPIIIEGERVGFLFPLELFYPEARQLEERFTQSVLYAVIRGTLLASFIAIAMGIWWSKKLTKPLENLVIAAKKVAKGDFRQSIEINTGDELASLAEAFNTMARELDKSQQNRKQMFADISHELRTPLTILGSKLEMALENDKSLDPRQISSLYDEVIRLQGLVKELQDLSKLEGGQIKLNIEKIDVSLLTRDLAILLEAEAEARGINFTIEIAENMDSIKADPLKLKQIILNLLSNAFRHTEAGGKVSLKMLKNAKHSIIEITDNGAGISSEDLPHIFQRFYRADKSRNRNTGGIGLGLAIAKGYIQAHQGEIEVESEEGKGTKFIIYLPR